MIRVVVRKLFINPRLIRLYYLAARLAAIISIIWLFSFPFISYSCHTEEKAIKPRHTRTTTDNAKAYAYFQDVKRDVIIPLFIETYSWFKLRAEKKYKNM